MQTPADLLLASPFPVETVKCSIENGLGLELFHGVIKETGATQADFHLDALLPHRELPLASVLVLSSSLLLLQRDISCHQPFGVSFSCIDVLFVFVESQFQTYRVTWAMSPVNGVNGVNGLMASRAGAGDWFLTLVETSRRAVIVVEC